MTTMEVSAMPTHLEMLRDATNQSLRQALEAFDKAQEANRNLKDIEFWRDKVLKFTKILEELDRGQAKGGGK